MNFKYLGKAENLDDIEKMNLVPEFCAENPDINRVYLLKKPDYDGAPRIILDCNIKTGTTEYVYVEGNLSRLIGCTLVYDYQEDIVQNKNLKESQELKKELESEETVLIYEKA